MFEKFETRVLPGGADVRIRARISTGSKPDAPPLLLLHGYPQTSAMWHRVAPALAENFTVVATDLRGYGGSDKPAGGEGHESYSKRAMAQDQVNVMTALGFDSFFLAGHDRGARVAHRLAVDHPQRVRKLAVLDIVPTRDMYRLTTMEFARAYYHWFFLIQPAPMPERMIGADPEFYLRSKMGSTGGGGTSLELFSPEAMEEYLQYFRDPETIRATCEDYRAAATIDLKHDELDLDRKITCPLLALWGGRGTIQRCFDALALWRDRASGSVEGEALPGGHYLAEELPGEIIARFRAFFT